MLEWHEVTLENRPPQNRSLLWCHYFAMNDGTWHFAGRNIGTYRFGLVKGPGGAFSIPGERWSQSARDLHRIFWAEVDTPHENGQIGPLFAWHEL